MFEPAARANFYVVRAENGFELVDRTIDQIERGRIEASCRFGPRAAPWLLAGLAQPDHFYDVDSKRSVVKAGRKFKLRILVR